MAVSDRVDDDGDAVACVTLGELFGGQDPVKKFAALHELHDEAPGALVLVDVIQSNNVWMINLLEHLDFCLQR